MNLPIKILLFLLLLGSSSLAGTRTWTSADGTSTFEGELISFDDPYVKVKRVGEWNQIAFHKDKLSSLDKAFLERFKIQQEALKKARQAISKNQYTGKFRIGQVTKEGVHAHLIDEIWNPNTLRRERVTKERIFIHGDFSLTVASNEIYSQPLYWTGSYTYNTTDGGTFTVRSYVIDEGVALRFWTSVYLPKHTDTKSGSQSNNRYNIAYGTSFAVSESYFVTNAHVIQDARSISILLKGNKIQASVVRIDSANDLALLHSPNAQAMPLILNLNGKIDLSDPIYVAGFPNPMMQGTSIKITNGIISALTGVRDDVRWLQISAAVQPGNSGGPLLDKNGRVIGIVNARLSDEAAYSATGNIPQNVNYAIKLDYLLPLLRTEPDLFNRIKSDSNAEKKARRISEVINDGVFLVEVNIP